MDLQDERRCSDAESVARKAYRERRHLPDRSQFVLASPAIAQDRPLTVDMSVYRVGGIERAGIGPFFGPALQMSFDAGNLLVLDAT